MAPPGPYFLTAYNNKAHIEQTPLGRRLSLIYRIILNKSLIGTALEWIEMTFLGEPGNGARDVFRAPGTTSYR